MDRQPPWPRRVKIAPWLVCALFAISTPVSVVYAHGACCGEAPATTETEAMQDAGCCTGGQADESPQQQDGRTGPDHPGHCDGCPGSCCARAQHAPAPTEEGLIVELAPPAEAPGAPSALIDGDASFDLLRPPKA